MTFPRDESVAAAVSSVVLARIQICEPERDQRRRFYCSTWFSATSRLTTSFCTVTGPSIHPSVLVHLACDNAVRRMDTTRFSAPISGLACGFLGRAAAQYKATATGLPILHSFIQDIESLFEAALRLYCSLLPHNLLQTFSTDSLRKSPLL